MDHKCTVYRTSNFLGKRWTMPILLELHKGKGKRRYSELKNILPGITPKVLSLRLKELEKEGLLSKKIDVSVYPIKSEYSLTSSGKDFIKIIEQMKGWAVKWKCQNKDCEKTDCCFCKN